ncbi:MAG: MFS transporter [Actinobacteria bacterium]|nr:MFS transporter [Actinomycetota bacterium]
MDAPSTPDVEASSGDGSTSSDGYTPRRVVVAYLMVSTLFTLASALIWPINSIFLLREGGLTLLGVMVVNAVFTLGSMVFEVPTGVVADTVGRKASLLMGMFTLVVSTLLYVATPRWGIGIWGFIGASVILGIGFTFQTGALEAWLVDALDATGWDSPKERVFAWGQMASGGGMLTGSLLGGLLAQVGLSMPYIVRAVLLTVAFVAVAVLMRDLGFQARSLRLATFGAETRRIFDAGVTFGWRSPVVRPLLWSSAAAGVFFMFAWYAWQPYILELLARDYVWLLGVVTAAFSLAGIVGNSLVGRIMGNGAGRRDSWRVLAFCGWMYLALSVGIAAVGLSGVAPGLAPAGIAIALWLTFGLVFGISGPVRMAYINTHIPSAQRATVLSLDAFFADGGGAAGQPALGWLSERATIPIAWVTGALFLVAPPLLYRASGKAAERAEKSSPTP